MVFDKKRTVIEFAKFFIILCLSFFVFGSQGVSALTGSDFKAARIIDDQIFYNSSSMSASGIQTFLNAKVPTCDTAGTGDSGHAKPGGGNYTRAEWGSLNGSPAPFICLKDYTQNAGSVAADSYCSAITGGTLSAAQIISRVATACHINPQGLVVLLQKEQGLVTDVWPWPIQYKTATGYGCPDGGSCNSAYYGFFNQVYRAARQFQIYKALPASYNYQAGKSVRIYYNPTASCGYSNVTIQSQATAGLYNYTPYQPNSATLSATNATGTSSPGGEVACGAYGNRNFWWYFNSWFGPTLIDVVYAQANDGSATQYVIYSGCIQAISSPATIYAWNIFKLPLQYFDPTILASTPSCGGGPLSQVVNTTLGTYFIDSGYYYTVSSNEKTIWGFGSPVSVGGKLFNLVNNGGGLGHFVSNPSTSTIYLVDSGTLYPISSPDILRIWGGNSVRHTSISSTYLSSMATGSTLSGPEFSYGGSNFVLSDGVALPVSAAVASVYPSWTALVISSALNSTYTRGPSLQYLIRVSGTSTVYLLEGGVKHPIQDGNIFNAFRSSGTMVQSDVSNHLASLMPTSSVLKSTILKQGTNYYLVNQGLYPIPAGLQTTYGVSSNAKTLAGNFTSLLATNSSNATRFVRAPNGGVYYLDNGDRHGVGSSSLYALLGGSNPVGMPWTTLELFTIKPSMKPYITNGTNSYLLDSGSKKFTVPSSSIADAWSLGSPVSVSSSSTDSFTSAGTLGQHIQLPNGFYALVDSGRYFRAEQQATLRIWGVAASSIIPSNQLLDILHINYAGALARFVIGKTGGPYANTIFTVAGGKLWGISSPDKLRNLGYDGSLITVSDSTISGLFSSTIWQGYLATDDSGSLWVLDGGIRRFVQSSYTTNWAGVFVPTVLGDDYLSILPRGANITKSVRYLSNTVYGMDNGYKRGITTSTKYTSGGWSPYSNISGSLFYTIPTGSNI